MLHEPLAFDTTLYQYLVDNTLRENDAQRELRRETSELPMAIMQVQPEQAQLMGLLLKLMGARNAIEIGVYTGYSALAIAQALPDDGKLIACDINAEWAAIGRKYWEQAGVGDKIDLRIGPAEDTLEALLGDGLGGTFDFCFVDADKSSYPRYYALGLELLRAGGLLVVDNVLWFGRVVDESDTSDDTVAIRHINRLIHEDERVDQVMLPVADGMTLVRKR